MLRCLFCLIIVFSVLYSLPAAAWSHGTAAAPAYYVDASAGNDSNPGTQASPWQTLHKVNNTVFSIVGTIINFQGSFSGGDNGLIFTRTNAPNGFITVQSYGTGATISSGNSTAGYSSTDVPGVQLKNLTFTGGGNGTNTTSGVTINININGQYSGPILSGLTISGYGSDCAVVWSNVDHGGWANPQFLNNTFHDCTGNDTTRLTACLRILGGGSFDGYPNFNLTAQGNLFYNCTGNASNNQGGGSGFFYADTLTALVQDNVAHDFGANDTHCGGPVGIWTYNSKGGVIQFNESYNGSVGGGGCDGGGFDLDLGTLSTTLQYNYAHHNINYGINICGCSTSGTNDSNIVRYNITENNSIGGSQGEMKIASTTAAITNLQVYNNTFYGPTCFDFVSTSGKTGSGKNNICIGTSAGTDIVSAAAGAQNSFTLDHNNYTGSAHFTWNGTSYTSFATYQAGSSQDANGNTTTPSLSGTAGTGGTCYTSGTPAGPQPCPSVYQLQGGSAQRDVGVSISSPGSVDYYGNAIPNGGGGTGYNIGAYGN